MTQSSARASGEILFAAPDISEDDIDAVVSVLRSGWITTGAESDGLEHDLSQFLGGDAQVVALSSCTAALEIAAAYHGLDAGKRVGIPTWTFASTALAIMRDGATPVLLDVDPDTLNIDVASLQRALDDGGLDALVAVHMGGVPVPREVHELCSAHDIPVIEDAAHALGAVDHRGPIGSASRAGTCFSFYATKNLTAAEGGALATSDPALANFARSYRLHGLSLDAYERYQPGRPVDYDLVLPGIKANLPDVLSALARSQLLRFSAIQARRRELVTRYRLNLIGTNGLRLLPAMAIAGSADHLMLVALPSSIDREHLRAAASAEGIGTSVHFRPLHTFSWLRTRTKVAPGGTPRADHLRHSVLSLPLHTRLIDGDVDRVCEWLGRYLSRHLCHEAK